MATEPISVVLAAPLIAKMAGLFAEPIKSTATRTKEKIQLALRRGFSEYIEKSVVRFSFVKTIISSSTPIPLLSIYVNLHLGHPKASLRDDDFLSQIAKYNNVLFSATAGAGKSMLMRYLYLRFLETQTDRLPVFIEMRDLNQYPETRLQDYIREKIEEYIDGFTDQQMRWAFETGKIVLFLDGFDEIDHDKRKQREREINDLSARYLSLWMFVSSRPAESFSSWQKFFVFRVEPFTKKQVELLISKISYDEEIKALFRKKLAEGLYETHQEFLINPLLTIMMLITLEQFAEVPAKIHLFYEYAFEALFGRHDVTKGGFQRKRHTGLALDDFKRLFAYFCMITYMREEYTFSATRVLEIIQQSLTSSQIETNKENYRNDLTESTCMLVLDGLDYTFSHRSFQEYFAAYFLSRVKVDEFSRAIPRLVQRGAFDGVLKMLSEMNREKFEEMWALPTLNMLCDRVKGLNAKKNFLEYAATLFDEKPYLVIGRRLLSVGKKGGTVTRTMMFSFMNKQGKLDEESDFASARISLYDVYGVFDKIHSRLNREGDEDVELFRGVVNGDILGSDERFNELRDFAKRNKLEDVKPIPLTERDGDWLRNSNFGKFISIEGEVLPELRDDVRRRVAERKRGLDLIFASPKENGSRRARR